jgi:hypothetical protein
MEKDWRTDNWAGHKPTKYQYNDPNLHFPRSTREIGWGDYTPQVGKESNVNWWMIGFFVVLFLLFHNLGAF